MSILRPPTLETKHRCAEEFSEHRSISQLEPEPKRQKCDHSTGGRSKTQQRPAEFWDNLSKVCLTKKALRELDRRNAVDALHREQLKRPPTRQFISSLQSRHLHQYAPDFLRSCGPECLKEINECAKHGGPDLSDLRNFPQYRSPLIEGMELNQLSQNRKRPLTTTRSSNKRSSRSGTYSRNFEQHLIDNGVYPEGYRYPNGRKPEKPKNWAEINQRLSQPRASLSPSRFTEEEYEKFKEANTDAVVELQTNSTIPTIEGGINDGKAVGGGYPFGNLKPLTDGTISSAWPDRFFGARPEQLDRQIRDKLHDDIIPSTQDSRPILPNFFLEVKSPDQSAAVAKRQACYDGALGARGVLSLQSYGKNEHFYHGNAHTITATYHDGQLKLYTSHIEPTGAGDKPEYFMTQLRSFSLTDTAETFRQGAAAYRNARDWTREIRDEVIDAANATLLRHESGEASISRDVSATLPTVTSIQYDSSTDWDATEFKDAQWSFVDSTGDKN